MSFLTRAPSAKRWLPVLALGLVVSMVAVDHAEARRAGGFGGVGARGARTVQTTPSTPTLPRTVAPIDPSGAARVAAPAAATTAASAGMARSGFFGGFGGSLLGGLFLGGLIGLAFGGGLGGFVGFLGLILQVGLIVLVVSLIAGAFRRRRQLAYAGAGASGGGSGPGRYSYGYGGAAGTGSAGGSSAARAARPRPANAWGPNDEIGVTRDDLGTFERLLGEVQRAYSDGDRDALKTLATPAMVTVLDGELRDNAGRGVRNEVRDVRLLQGDLAEAWREAGTDYATVAMRYASVDATRDIASGRVVAGDADKASETIELWTFAREGGAWKVSAIQES